MIYAQRPEATACAGCDFWNQRMRRYIRRGAKGIALIDNSRGSYGTWLGEDTPPAVRGQLEGLIDTARGHGYKDFDSFLAAMKAAGVEIKRGKHLTFKIPNRKRFIRCDSLSYDYTEAAIMERISGKRVIAPRAKAARNPSPISEIDRQETGRVLRTAYQRD